MKKRNLILSILTLSLVNLSVVNLHPGELKSLIPTTGELTPFIMSEDPQYYYPDNLYDYINGAAPIFNSYGMEEMVTFIVMNKNDSSEIVVDIYGMQDSLNAFGIYSIERSPEYKTVSFGSDGFHSDVSLFFWQDTYYVKLMAYEDLPGTAESLTQLAGIISGKIPKRGSRPYIFSIFPEKEQIKASERYINQDVLGQEYFTNGYSIEYDHKEYSYHVFLIQGVTNKQTKQNFLKYQTHISINDQIINDNLSFGDQAFIGKDNYYGKMLFARKGTFIIGILGMEEQKIAEQIISGMLTRLGNNIGKKIY